MCSEAYAANKYWIGAASGNFNDTLRWSLSSGGGNDTTPPDSGDVAIFDGAGVGDVAITDDPDVAGIDIQAGYSGTISQNSGVEITVGASGFSQADGTFSGGDAVLDFNGPINIAGGNFSVTSSNTEVASDLAINGAATFFHGNGTFLFNGPATRTVDIVTAQLNNVTLNMSGGDLIVTGTMNIDGTFTVTAVNSINTGVIAASGNVITTDGGVAGDGVVRFDGGVQSLSVDGANGNGALPGIEINNSGTLTIDDNIELDGTSGWTFVTGNVDTKTLSSALIFDGSDNTFIDDSTTEFNDVELSFGGASLDVTGTMDVDGIFTITLVNDINTGSILVSNNVITTDGSVTGSGKLVFDGVNQELYSNKLGGTGAIPAIEINNTGTLTIFDNIQVEGDAGWLYTSGDVDATSQNSKIDFTNSNSKTVNDTNTVFNDVEVDMVGAALTVTGSMNVDGDFMLSGANEVNGGVITVAGDLTLSDTTVGGTAAVTLDGTGAQTINSIGGGDLPNGTFTINKSDEVATLISNLTLDVVGQDLSILSGTLDLAGFDLSLTGVGDVLTVADGATLQLQGGETVTASTLDLQTGSTVIYNGTGTYLSFPLGNVYHHLTFDSAGSGDWSQMANLDVNGDFSLLNGVFDSNFFDINIAGRWTNYATYYASGNIVTFDGSSNSIYGSTTFNDVIKIGSQTIVFQAGSTQTFLGDAMLQGASVGNELLLRSSSLGNRANLNFDFTTNFNFLDVQDSNVTNSSISLPISPPNSPDSGNNLNWFSTATPVTISGVAYTDLGSTPVANGIIVRLVVNGVESGVAVTAGGNGAYSFDTMVSDADALLVYLDTDGGASGTTVTVSNGANLSGLNIYGSQVIVRNDKSGVMTNSLMNDALQAYSDPDVDYSISAGNLLINTSLYVWGGDTFSPGGDVTTNSDFHTYGVFNGGIFTIEVNDDFNIYSGGTFNSTSGELIIASNTNFFVGSAFNHNSGTVMFDNGTSRTVSTNSQDLFNVELDLGVDAISISGQMNVKNDFTIKTVNTVDGDTIAVEGNVYTADTSFGSPNGTLLLTGGNDQIVMANGTGGEGEIPSLHINKSSGVVTLQNHLHIDGTSGLEYIDNGLGASGVVTTGTTITFGEGNKSITPSTMHFNDVVIDVSSLDNFGITGTLDINGDLSVISAGGINGVITLAGDFNIDGAETSISGSGSITLDGVVDQTIDVNGTGDFSDGNITIDKSSGSVTLLSAIDNALNAAGQNLFVTQGTLDLGDFDITVNDSIVIGSTGTLVSANSDITLGGSLNNSGSFTSSSGTVSFVGTGQAIAGNNTFYNVVKTVATADTFTIAENSVQTVNGFLSLSGAAGNLLTIQSNGADFYTFNVTSGDQSVTYLNVYDAHASGNDIYASNSFSLGGNNDDVFLSPQWVFGFTPIVTNNLDSTTQSIAGSLRYVIENSSATDTITFNTTTFPPSTPTTISLTGNLPSITQGNITIDASNAGVTINGDGVASDCLTIDSNDNEIKGLEITGCTSDGINITSGTNNTIGGDNTVGSSTLGEGNRVHGNGAHGIDINSNSNFVYGNYIGNTDGLNSSENIRGVYIAGDNNSIGGALDGQRNIISGNNMSGIYVHSTADSTVIKNNYIGVDATGDASLNNVFGVSIFGTNTTLGGSSAGERNIISGNSTYGIIATAGSDGVTVHGNIIGLSNAEDKAIQNGTGVRVSTGATNVSIGGVAAGEANVIAGNSSSGISVSSASAAISTNYIGVNSSGTSFPHGAAVAISIGGVSIVNLSGNLDIHGDITLSSGTLNLGSSSVYLAGNWTYSSGIFNADTSTVILDGVTQTITGSNTFYNLSKISSVPASITFDNTAIQTISNDLTLQGANNAYLTLQSDSLGNQWDIDPQGAINISYLAVSDSNNTNGGTINGVGTNSINAGNNTAWSFDPMPSTTWTGATDSNWNTSTNWLGNSVPGTGEVALFTAAYNVDANIDVPVDVGGMQIIGGYSGTITQQSGQTLTVGSSGFTQSNGTFNGGDSTITIGGPVTISDGTFTGGSSSIDVTGVFLQSGGSLTATSSTLSVLNELHLTGGTFSNNSGTIRFWGSGNKYIDIASNTLNHLFLDSYTNQIMFLSDVDVDGDLTITGTGRFYTTGSKRLTVAGNIDTVDTDVGDNVWVVIDGASNQTISASNSSGAIPSLWIEKSGGTLFLEDHLIIGGGQGIEYVSGSVDFSGLDLLELSGGSKTIDLNGLTWQSDVRLNQSLTGQLYFDSDFDLDGNLEIIEVDRFWTQVDAKLYLSGNLLSTDTTGNSANVELVFDGATDQLLSASGGTGSIPAINIAKTGGTTLIIQDNIDISGGTGTQGWVYTSGIVDISGLSALIFSGYDKFIDDSSTQFTSPITIQINDGTGDFYVNNTWDVNSDLIIDSASRLGGGGTINVAGDLAFNDTSNTNHSGALKFVLDGSSDQTISSNNGVAEIPGDLIDINKTTGTVFLDGNFTLANTGHDLTVTNGTFDLNGFDINVLDTLDITSNGTLQLNGNESVTAGAFTLSSGSTVNYVGTSGLYTLKDWDYENLIINSSDGDGVFELGALESVVGDLTISAGTLDLNSFALGVNGVLSNDGVLRLQGSETLTLVGGMDSDSGTVEYDGAGVYPSLAAQYAYFNLVFNGPGSWTQTADLSVNGDLSILSGSLLSNNNITLTGNWLLNNSANYTAGTNTFLLNGISQTLSGSTIFHHLSKSSLVADSLTFTAGDTFTVAGDLGLSGEPGQLLSLSSSVPGTEWFIIMDAGTQAIDYVSVVDSNASGGETIYPVLGTSDDLGHNTNWAFGGAASGVVGEITPTRVLVDTLGQSFSYIMLPTITATDTGINRVELTLPTDYRNVQMNSVSVGGTAISVGDSCPSVGVNEYCFSLSGQMLTIDLGSKATTSLAPIAFTFSVDTPSVPGSADFTARVDDTDTLSISSQPVLAGDADGVVDNDNGITVTLEGPAVSAVLAEISPNLVPIGTLGESFIYDLLTTIEGSDGGFNQISLLIPEAFDNVVFQTLMLDGTTWAAGSGCPDINTLGANEYCQSLVDSVLTLDLGSQQTVSGHLQFVFVADAPADAAGSAEFVASLDDTETILVEPVVAVAGNADGDADDANSITVIVAGDAVESVIGEIDPTRVTVNQQDRALSFFLRPTITVGNTGFNIITLSAPEESEYDDLQALRVVVGEDREASEGVESQTAVEWVAGENCPTVASGEFCVTPESTNTTLRIELGDKIIDDQTRVQLDFSVDTPSQIGSSDFSFSVDDTLTATIAAQAGSAGDADGNAENGNTLTVTIRLGTDPLLSTFTIAPNIVVADGETEAVLAVTLLDSNGTPVDDKLLTITTDREGLDIINYGPAGAESDTLNNQGSAISTSEKANKQLIEQTQLAYRKSDTSGLVEARIKSLVGGIVTLTATDADGIELLTKPELLFTQGQVLQLTKRTNKRRAVVGDVITYSIDIQNTLGREIVLTQLHDVIPPNFKYLKGTARLNDKVLADPTGQRTLVFDTGTIPAMIDRNNNGIADNGESGAVTLIYQMVVGAGARPGDYVNQVHAVDVCDTCRISNESEVTVEVVFDPLFDLGNIIGKVFNDHNGNGTQDEALSEFGVANVKVVLDNGTYALTDDNGRYHFPAILPGDRLLKVDITALPKGTLLTSSETQVVTVTPGLMAKANFGVSSMVVEQKEQLGKAGKTASKLQRSLTDSPLQFVGSLTQFSLLVNGIKIPLPKADVTLRSDDQPTEVISYNNAGLSHPAHFSLAISQPHQVTEWRLEVIQPGGQLVHAFEGKGKPPKQVKWFGLDQGNRRLEKDRHYLYQLNVSYRDGSRARSALRLLGVEQAAFIQITLPEHFFLNGGPAITADSKVLLQRAGNLLRQFPKDSVLIQGASTSGKETVVLARRKARAAKRFLINNQEIDEARIETRWDGESRAQGQDESQNENKLDLNNIADTGSIARQLEVIGEVATLIQEIRQRPRVTLNSMPVNVDQVGRFHYHSNNNTLSDEWHFTLTHTDGRSVDAKLELPSLAIIAPEPENWLYHGQETQDYFIEGLAHIESLLDEETSARYQLRGTTTAGNKLTINGQSVTVDLRGEFSFPLQLKTGLNRYYFVMSNPQGMRRLSTLDLTLAHHYRNGHPFYFDLPEPAMEVSIPPDGALLTRSLYTITGKTEHTYRVEINDQEVEVNKEGEFSQRLQLQPGENTLQVRTTDRGGFVSVIERTVTVNEAPYFFMAFADGKVSQLKRSGYLAGTGSDQEKEIVAEGRLAFYFKGWVKGKYLVTAAFDSGQGEVDTLFQDLNRSQSQQLLTNLDPETLYPVYGDESTLVNDVESRGKFYLAVESEHLKAKLGNFALQWSDTELASYQRSLYGLRTQVRWDNVSTDEAPEKEVLENEARVGGLAEKADTTNSAETILVSEADLFISDVNQIHVRDEILTTGGSLYYLSHAQVIEGSEQVTLVVRDRETGLILSRTPQDQNNDYTIDYDQGRLLFNRPLSNLSRDERLADSGLFDGNPQTLQVDYEYETDAFAQHGIGLRAKQQVGNLQIGGTYLQDDLGTGQYTLKGLDVALDLQRNSRVFLELATSEGTDGYAYQSDDGGLSYYQQRSQQNVTAYLGQNRNQPLYQLDPLMEDPLGQNRSGSAWKLGGEFDLGAWLENPDRYHAAFYLKQTDENFLTNGTFLEQGHQKAGLLFSALLTEKDSLRGRYDIDNTFDIKGYNSLANLQWLHQQDSYRITSELQTKRTTTQAKSSANSTSSASHSSLVHEQNLLAIKGDKQWNSILSTSLEQQLTLSGEANDQTQLGAQIQATQHIALEGKVGVGDRGEAAQLGVGYDDGQRRLYLMEQAKEDAAGTQTQSTIVGSESQLGHGTVYTEHQWERTETAQANTSSNSNERTLAVVGTQQSWDLKPGLNFTMLGEIGDIQAQSGSSKRYVAGSGLSYNKPQAWKASTYLEWRLERGSIARSQWLSKNALELKLNPDYTLLSKYYVSLTTDENQEKTEAAFEERSIGLAYRPITHDKFNALGRYSHIKDQRPLGSNPGEDRTRMSVVSLDMRYDITGYLAWTEKLAGRIKDETVASLPTVTSQTILMIHRLDLKLPKKLGFGAEYRSLTVDLANDQRDGWLSEFTWQAHKHAKLGIGYNFTDFSDNLYQVNDYREQGGFLRVQGAW